MRASGLVAIVVCASLSYLVVPANAQSSVSDGGLVIEVHDTADAPISNAYVLLHNFFGARDPIIKNAGGGRFEVSLAPGLYDVFVGAKGFAPMCKAVRVEPGKSLHIPLRLHLDWEHMEESSYR